MSADSLASVRGLGPSQRRLVTEVLEHHGAALSGHAGAWRCWPVDSARETVIGRAPRADVLLPDEHVSERHAVIAPDGWRWSLHDAGSTNGTLLNGTRHPVSPRLTDGDVITVGRTQLVFHTIHAAGTAPLDPPLDLGALRATQLEFLRVLVAPMRLDPSSPAAGVKEIGSQLRISDERVRQRVNDLCELADVSLGLPLSDRRLMLARRALSSGI